MMKYLALGLLSAAEFFASSCSHLSTQPTNTYSSPEIQPANDIKPQVKQDVPNTIIGGARIDKSGNHTSKAYFLDGAEDLNLENYYFDIPVVYNDSVKKWIHYFSNRGRDYFETYSARGGRYAPMLGNMLEDNGLPRDLIYLAMAESGFQAKAKSYAKAVGLWQFIPSTGRHYGLKIDWYIDERRDPIKSTIAASKYLKKLYEDYGDWEIAASAYNAGEGKVNRAIARYKTDNFWDLRKGRYLKSETKNYVPKIMALAILGKNLNSFGFKDIEFHGPIDFIEIEVPSKTDLVTLAQEMKIDVEDIYSLNPELLRWYIPPTIEMYRLRVPAGTEVVYEQCCANKNFIASAFQKYRPDSVSTIALVAKKFRIAPYVLEDLNSVRASTRVTKDQEVILPFREGQDVKEAMYADLYERPRKRVRAHQTYKGQIKLAKASGQKINNPKEFYTVQKGDTLWSVSKKTGTPVNALINTNISVVDGRMIKQGDKLAVR
jgi:membrane-bound lytic murein transglycosylase D